MDYDKLNDQYPVAEVIARYGISVRNGAFKCPFHDDHQASGSVYTASDGRQRWKCHVCELSGDSLDFVQQKERCDRGEAIRKLTGQDPPRPERRSPPDLKVIPKTFDFIPFPKLKADAIRPGNKSPDILHASGKRFGYTPYAVYRYQNFAGDTVLMALRCLKPDGAKTFVQLRYDRTEGYVAKGWAEKEPRLLYNERELRFRPRDTVLLVEGEKCVDYLKNLPQFADLVVVSWQGGAQAVNRQQWDRLEDRNVILWPDADPPKGDDEDGVGVKAMRRIAKLAKLKAPRLVLPLAEWYDRDCGYDAVDLLKDCNDDATEVRRIMDNLAVVIEEPEPEKEPPPNDRHGERIQYSTNKEGDLAVGNHRNWWTYIKSDPRFGHDLTLDVIDKQVLIDGRPLSDMAIWNICEEMEIHGRWRGLTLDRLGPMLSTLAQENTVNRLAEKLRALGKTWDGIERHLLDYAGAPRGDWAAVAGWRWLLGWVKRMLEPGCQHDLVLVLEGRQGMRKTSFFRTLGQIFDRDLYTELSRLSQEKDTQLKLVGKTIVELSEMTAHRQGETDMLKGMITAMNDRFRPPYAKETIDMPRTCVFCGTTNEQQYLKDPTGNRRYLIVEVTQPADIDGLRRDLPQILAEAVVALERGELNTLTDEEGKLQTAAAVTRELDWPQFYELEQNLEQHPELTEMTRAEVWNRTGILGDRRTQALQRGLTYTMEKLGWKYVNTGKARVWRRPKLDPGMP